MVSRIDLAAQLEELRRVGELELESPPPPRHYGAFEALLPAPSTQELFPAGPTHLQYGLRFD